MNDFIWARMDGLLLWFYSLGWIGKILAVGAGLTLLIVVYAVAMVTFLLLLGFDELEDEETDWEKESGKIYRRLDKNGDEI